METARPGAGFRSGTHRRGRGGSDSARAAGLSPLISVSLWCEIEQVCHLPFYSQLCHIKIAVSVSRIAPINLLKTAQGRGIRAGIRAHVALQKESPLGGCAARVANLGGGGHPVAQASWASYRTLAG